MAEAADNSGTDSAERAAERAYAAAAESAVAKADAGAADSPQAKKDAEPLDFPAKPARSRTAPEAKPAVAAAPVAATKVEAAPVAAPVVAAPVLAGPATVAKEAPAPAPVKAPAVKKASAPKQTPAASKPAKVKKPRKPVAVKQASSKLPRVAAKHAAPAQAAKPAKPVLKSTTKFSPILAIKETIMATKKTTDFTTTIKTAAADVQAKAKVALAKGSEVIADVSDFTKGNVDAVVASGKILAAGMQDLGKTYVAEGKTAYETMTADVKELTAVKSPVDFVRVQTAIVRRNLDQAFSLGAKNSEAVLKLAGESFAPISARVSLAVEKVKKAA